MNTAPGQKHQSIDNIDYNGRIFQSVENTANGEVSAATTFRYHQDRNTIWADYQGGSIVRGHLIATRDESSNVLNLCYHHINTAGEMMTGKCVSTPEILADGRIRLHEKWQWTSGDCSSGTSIVEEVPQGV